jgi:hypothetical protein
MKLAAVGESLTDGQRQGVHLEVDLALQRFIYHADGMLFSSKSSLFSGEDLYCQHCPS